LLLDIDVQGAAQVKSRMQNSVGILVVPPSRQVLEKRLRTRSISEGSVSDEVIERRLTEARKEIENFPNYDYILVNDRLEDSVELLESIVLSERLKSSGKVLSPEEVRMVQTAEQCLQTAKTTSSKLKEVLASFAPAISG
jgi:guanylate kinase